ncbi:hypothetical protein RR48_01046 [Papilio machaon]|uniref:THAP-type domain-containing protein n=1 Tax=Papilio machaon TaxID=76193 RepID=A0A0N0PBC7_PAPMA|nr:hypothetical protein RR48_01046 [Papilio machaon]
MMRPLFTTQFILTRTHTNKYKEGEYNTEKKSKSNRRKINITVRETKHRLRNRKRRGISRHCKNSTEVRCVCKTGPLHSFPSPSYPHEDRFNKWKSVLGEDLKNKGNDYIHKNVRLCRRHFEGHFHTSGNRLTANSIPTLNLFVNDGSIPVTGLEHQTVPDVISVQIPSFSRGTKKVFAKKVFKAICIFNNK